MFEKREGGYTTAELGYLAFDLVIAELEGVATGQLDLGLDHFGSRFLQYRTFRTLADPDSTAGGCRRLVGIGGDFGRDRIGGALHLLRDRLDGIVDIHYGLIDQQQDEREADGQDCTLVHGIS